MGLAAKLLCFCICICIAQLQSAEVASRDADARRLPKVDEQPKVTRQKTVMQLDKVNEKKAIHIRTWIYGIFLLLISPALAIAMVYATKMKADSTDGGDAENENDSAVVDEIRDEAAIRGLLLPFSNCFIDEATEESYVKANAENLCNRCFYVVVAVGLYALSETIFTYDIRARVIFKPIFRRWDSNARVVYNSTWITMFCSSFVTAVIMRKCSKDERKRHMDKLMAAWTCLIFLLMIFTGNRYNACSLFSEDPLESFTHYDADAKMVLNFIVLIMVVTLHTPLRFCVLAPTVFVLPFVYVVQSIWLGGPDGGLWTIAFGYPHPAFLGEMGYMDFFQACWFLSIIILIMFGQRNLEIKARCDFKAIAESAKMIQELQIEDNQSKGSSQLQRASTALDYVESSLKELSNHRAIVKNALSEEMTRLIKQIHVAQKTLKNADRLFAVKVADVLEKQEFAEYKDNKDIHGFVAMTGATESRSDSVFYESSQSTVLPLVRGRHVSVKRETMVASKLDSELVRVLDSIGHDWNFDPIDLARSTGNASLIHVGEMVIVQAAWRGALIKNKVDEGVCRKFLREVHRRYPKNDYHNEMHAACVTHMALWFATETGFIATMASDLERTALMVAAVCHDVGHIGRNNLYIKNAMHSISMIWNDSAVLENMHASVCFMISDRDGCKIFGDCSRKEQVDFRELIIDLILATDLKSHNESITKYAARCEAEDFLQLTDRTTDAAVRYQADKKMLAKLIMQSSDIGHAGLPWKTHEEWSLRVICEFFEQGDEEKRLGLPVSPLCERKGYNIASNQSFFIDYIARSCIIQLERTAQDDGKENIQKEVLGRCDENKNLWKDHYPGGLDSENHRIDVIEKSKKPVAKPVIPYDIDGATSEALTDLVSNEVLLSEIATYRSKARALPKDIVLPKAH